MSFIDPPFPPRDAFDVFAYDDDEVINGYLDGHRDDDIEPGPNHSPAYRWGWLNRRPDHQEARGGSTLLAPSRNQNKRWTAPSRGDRPALSRAYSCAARKSVVCSSRFHLRQEHQSAPSVSSRPSPFVVAQHRAMNNERIR